MVEAVVEFDYTADAEDELTLQVGEVIANIKIMDGGWWEGELRGKRGMFPDNFVKLTKEQTPPPTKVANERTHLTIEEEEKNKVNKPVTKRGGADKIRSLRAKACYSYTPQNDDELGLKIGDTIEVINQEEPGWWEGTINGRVGVFPSNFVEVVEEDEDEKAKAELKEPKQPPPPPPSQTSEGDTKPKKAMGMGFGDIFKNGQPKLRKTGSTLERGTQPPRVLPTSSSPTEEKTTPIETTKEQYVLLPPAVRGSLKRGTPQPTAVDTAPKKVKRAKVLFSYSALNSDELSLKEGEIVTVLSQDGGDQGWWRGEVHGKVGVFPDNFVQLIEDHPEPQSHVHFPPDRPKKPPPPNKPKPTVAEKPTRPDKPSKPNDHLLLSKDDKSVGGKSAKLPELPVQGKKEKKEKKAPPIPPGQSSDSNKLKEPEIFDAVQPSPEKLTHPTKFRANNPNRRPPSVRVRGGSPTETDGSPAWMSDSKKGPKRPPIPDNFKNNDPPHLHAQSKAPRPNSTSTAVTKPGSGDSGSRLMNHAESNGDSEIIHELREELRSMKESMDALRREFLSEIDEEKKQRMTMQVELDRLKKLVMK